MVTFFLSLSLLPGGFMFGVLWCWWCRGVVVSVVVWVGVVGVVWWCFGGVWWVLVGCFLLCVLWCWWCVGVVVSVVV